MPLTTESTTFTRDVQGRYICSTWEEATIDPLGIDVVVLGGGLYGGYCASKIYEMSREKLGGRNLRVLVLEAGPFVVPGHTQNIPNLGLFDPFGEGPVAIGPGANPGTRKEVWGVGWRSNKPFVGQAYCVGGKGIYWGGWCPRLQAVDLQQGWPEEVRQFLTQVDPIEPVGFRPITHFDPTTGKNLPRGEALTGYEAIEYEIGVQPTDDFVFDPVQITEEGAKKKVGLNEALRVFLQQEIGNINGEVPSGATVTQVLPAPIAVQTQSFLSGLFSLDKYSSVPAMTAAARADHSDGLERPLGFALVPNCHVVRVEFRGDAEAPGRGTRVIERIVVRVGGQQRELTIAPHCQLVLAMSAIESTRLALESFSLVGSGLRDPGDELMGRNYMIHVRFDISFDVDRANFAAWVAARWPGHELADVLQLASLHVQCDGPNGRYQFQLYAATNEGGPDANMYRMVPDLSIQQQIADGFRDDKIRLVLRSSGETFGGRGERVGHPDFDYIDLAGAGDFDGTFGHARAWVQFNRDDHQADPVWQDMHDTGHAIARSLADPGGPDYRGANFTIGAVKSQQGMGTTFHDSGTLWMGDDPDRSVTDAAGHFHHVTNAYCCDQALFTSVGSANPVLTGVALARKVAGDIVDRHRGPIVPVGLPGLAGRSLLESDGWLQAPYRGMNTLDSASGGLLETVPTAGLGLYFLPEEMGDFDLAIEWKAFRTFQGNDVIANAGLLIRTPDPRGVDFGDSGAFNAFYDATTEIQIDETGKRYDPATGRSVFGDSRYKTGALYGITPARLWAAKVASPDGSDLGDRYWNTYEISARGRNVVVVLNGRMVCQSAVPMGKNLRGFLGLQFHTGRVQFRNLRLKRDS